MCPAVLGNRTLMINEFYHVIINDILILCTKEKKQSSEMTALYKNQLPINHVMFMAYLRNFCAKPSN